jgi:hypothetical protein
MDKMHASRASALKLILKRTIPFLKLISDQHEIVSNCALQQTEPGIARITQFIR